MNWKKLGCILKIENKTQWLTSHTANPFAVPQADGRVQVYFSARDSQNRSSVASLILELAGEEFKVSLSEQQLLAPGVRGSFDESGISVGSVLVKDGREHLYYLGWELGKTTPFKNTIGLATREVGADHFERVSLAPIFGRHNVDPFTLSYPCVLFEDGLYRMWYGSHLAWKEGWQEMEHVIKYAESSDGINWKREGQICINLEHKGEWGISRPVVIKDPDFYRMWYSYVTKASPYRIGYAESRDGIHWQRKDHQVGIDVGPDSFDSSMLCYPNVFDHQGERYMLYSGDDFGREGLGLAILS